MRLLIHGFARSGTTPTQRIINSHPEICITNEFCLYDYAFGYYLDYPSRKDIKPDLAYFKSLIEGKGNVANKKGYSYIDPPFTFNPSTFVQECLNNCKDSGSAKDRIMAVEKSLFKKDYEYFGDKVMYLEAIEDMYRIGLDFKLIYVYKDGRDNIASRIFRDWPPLKGESRSETWARYIFRWFDFRKKLNKDDYIELKFEDFSIDKNVNKIADFLGIDVNPLKKAQELVFDFNKSHSGHYKKIIPNWQKSFGPRAREALKLLGYLRS